MLSLLKIIPWAVSLVTNLTFHDMFLSRIALQLQITKYQKISVSLVIVGQFFRIQNVMTVHICLQPPKIQNSNFLPPTMTGLSTDYIARLWDWRRSPGMKRKLRSTAIGHTHRMQWQVSRTGWKRGHACAGHLQSSQAWGLVHEDCSPSRTNIVGSSGSSNRTDERTSVPRTGYHSSQRLLLLRRQRTDASEWRWQRLWPRWRPSCALRAARTRTPRSARVAALRLRAGLRWRWGACLCWDWRCRDRRPREWCAPLRRARSRTLRRKPRRKRWRAQPPMWTPWHANSDSKPGSGRFVSLPFLDRV